MNESQLALNLLIFLLGAGLGAIFLWLYHHFALGGYKKLSADIISRAEHDGSELKRAAELTIQQKQIEQQRDLEQLWQQERKKIQREEERIKQREDKIESRMNLVEKKLSDIEKREAVLIGRKAQVDEEKKNASETHARLILELEKASGLSSLEAKEMLMNRLMNEVKAEAANHIRRVKKEAEEEAEMKASTIIATAINRLAVPCASETTVCTVSLPNDEMKGRIIGREGRNIRTLEQATGVNFIIDDTPGAVVLSGFDPIRKHIAKIALTELVQDGRIHPTRIEEVVEKATINMHKQIKQFGEDAAFRAGAMNLHPEIIVLLGKLKFRYSYGQNVLDHSLEVSNLMGLMAAELGLDIRLAKRIGLLHDMGKAVTHEIEGSHAIIGHDLALKYGESKEVANGIGCHHNEMPPLTIEADLCSPADAISASREGARIEAVEEYIKRLKRLEDIAYEFPGVEKAYAMQAGREVRIAVVPELIDDAGIINLARDITKRIEQELSYPGKIKVTVIREKRVIEYAV
ncbi:MAG: ribonuclease Y [Parachlamydiaceae bacterium]|nr:ribonuclease Y [Parachlamydiaceae bacterium]